MRRPLLSYGAQTTIIVIAAYAFIVVCLSWVAISIAGPIVNAHPEPDQLCDSYDRRASQTGQKIPALEEICHGNPQALGG